MRGAEAVMLRRPESEKFLIEYWALEEAKLARMPAPKPLAGRVGFVTGAVPASAARSRCASRPRAPASSWPTSMARPAEERGPRIGGPDAAVSVVADVTEIAGHGGFR